MFRIALVLADLERLAIDVGQESARRLAVEARGWNEHVVALDAAGPGARVELGPVVPAVARRERHQLGAARAGIVLHASGTACPAPTCACSYARRPARTRIADIAAEGPSAPLRAGSGAPLRIAARPRRGRMKLAMNASRYRPRTISRRASLACAVGCGVAISAAIRTS